MRVDAQGFNNLWRGRVVPPFGCAHDSESHAQRQPGCLPVISHFGWRDRLTRQKKKKPCLAPHRQHMSTIFWGLVSSEKVLMELCFGICTCRRSCSIDRGCRGGGGGGGPLCVSNRWKETWHPPRESLPRSSYPSLPTHTQDANSHRQLLTRRCVFRVRLS